MSLFSDLILDSSASSSRGKGVKSGSGKAGWGKGLYGDDEDEYDDYYEDLYDDAAAGDSDAIDEMEDEFGDDWEGEY